MALESFLINYKLPKPIKKKPQMHKNHFKYESFIDYAYDKKQEKFLKNPDFAVRINAHAVAAKFAKQN
jgi:hypothetical protein